MLKKVMDKIKSMIEPQFLSTYVVTAWFEEGDGQLMLVDAYSAKQARDKVMAQFPDIEVIDVK